MKKAFIFDMNGTMIDDMAYHLEGWFNILNDDLGAGMTREAVKREMYGKNQELLIRIFGKNRFTEAEMDALSMEKERKYQQAYLPHLRLIPGLDTFLEAAEKEGILMGIGTAAIPFNVDFALDNLQIRHYFKSIITANDVATSKPNPEVFLKAAEELGVDPANCIVFEDAPKGVEAAANAGMKAVVLTTMHTAEEFIGFDNILTFVPDYTTLSTSGLFR
ncbi:HAD family hydrolase [Chitinophaga pinensis]|uniref:HAD-superfamily hydrolase, subfamily IA, variant 3 n=1 Tax=Chitinophaga pinensis (strain ATCC 43595 / DSM 2588 / LMG 13176 / NBRC 15968 / NCIMB 11800 / UQM 2034) TaxID=485918 RepID=A0A979G5Y4_CHIPD|nr:HAD family phosphatase [Chitinophaga pinensis]ACU61454.1 HAD-superfamily hydrolase, subfamily IA, variant 3 [Chitinophaga pinensis DSM 2588]